MKLGQFKKSHYLMPTALICGYGLFAVTAPPSPTEDEPTAGLTASDKPIAPTPRALAEDFPGSGTPTTERLSAR